MSDEVNLTRAENDVATLTFNRPDKLNALSRELLFKSIATLKQWRSDPEVSAIILTGAGRAFCAGGDVGNMASEHEAPETLEQKIDGLSEAQELTWQIYNLPNVTIAAVNGYAMGAGLGVCLACDLRIASAQAKFGTAYAKVGFGGDFGTTWLLARLAGPAKAKELFFLGDIVDATEAERIGLVNRVAAHDELMAQVNELAARI